MLKFGNEDIQIFAFYVDKVCTPYDVVLFPHLHTYILIFKLVTTCFFWSKTHMMVGSNMSVYFFGVTVYLKQLFFDMHVGICNM